MYVITGTTLNTDRENHFAYKMTCMITRFYNNISKCNAVISGKIKSIQSKYIISRTRYQLRKRQKMS